MADRQFLSLVRIDVESFRWSPVSNQAELYPETREIWDQTQLLARLVELLDVVGARGTFAVAYDILKNRPEMLAPIMQSPGKHEITWLLDLRHDRGFLDDWGGEAPADMLVDCREPVINQILDKVHAVCEQALGFVPTIHCDPHLAINAPLLRVLEARGYQAETNYAANLDRRTFTHAYPYDPYAPNNIYVPNRWDGMLLGEMTLVEIPLSQLRPGKGNRPTDAYRDPETEIGGILSLYDREIPLTTCAMRLRTAEMIAGPDLNQINDQALDDLNRILGFVRALPGQKFAGYLDAREAHLAQAPSYTPGQLAVHDAANGVMAHDGSSTLKIHALGEIDPAAPETIGQENGIAQWVFQGVSLGPEIAPRMTIGASYHPAVLTVDLVSGADSIGLPRKDLHYVWQAQSSMLGVNLVDTEGGHQFLYVLHENDALSITAIPRAGEHTPIPIFVGNFHPKFRPVEEQGGRVLLKHLDADLYIELRLMRLDPNGQWIAADVESQVSTGLYGTIVGLAASAEMQGAVMLVALPFLTVPEGTQAS